MIVRSRDVCTFRSVGGCLVLAKAAFESVSEVRGSGAKHARREKGCWEQTTVLTTTPAAACLGFCKESIPARACMAHRLPFGWRRAGSTLTKTNLEEESGYEFARRYRMTRPTAATMTRTCAVTSCVRRRSPTACLPSRNDATFLLRY